MKLKKLAIILTLSYCNTIHCMSIIQKKWTPSKLPIELRIAFDGKEQTEQKLKETIEIFLKNHGDIEAIDGRGKTMLTRACQEGYVEIIKYLISKGANIEAEDHHQSSNFTPLEWSILFAKEESIKTLVSLGASLTHHNPLELAISFGKLNIFISIINALIKRDPNFLITKELCDAVKKIASEKDSKEENQYEEILSFLEYQIKLEMVIRIINKRKSLLNKIPGELLSTIIRFAYGPKNDSFLT